MLLQQLGLNEREAEGLVESFYAEISLALESGESVNLAGFRYFEKDAFTASEKLKVLTGTRGSCDDQTGCTEIQCT